MLSPISTLDFETHEMLGLLLFLPFFSAPLCRIGQCSIPCLLRESEGKKKTPSFSWYPGDTPILNITQPPAFPSKKVKSSVEIRQWKSSPSSLLPFFSSNPQNPNLPPQGIYVLISRRLGSLFLKKFVKENQCL